MAKFGDVRPVRMEAAGGPASGMDGAEEGRADPVRVGDPHPPRGGGATLDLTGRSGACSAGRHEPPAAEVPSQAGREWALSAQAPEGEAALVPPTARSAVLAVNVGSRVEHVAADGTLFAADASGIGRATRTGAIAGTTEHALYRSGVWSAEELSYDLDLADGTYAVTLHFAETSRGAFADGVRVFDVALEGRVVEDDLDVHARVGARAALAVEHVASVTDGVLDIDLPKGAQNPILSGIEIERLDDAPAEPAPAEPTPAAGGALARDDAFVFDWDREVRVDPAMGVASVRLSASDLLANDEAGEWPQILVEREPSEGVLQLAGEASDITFLFDPARFDGAASFAYRALGDGDGDAISGRAAVTLEVRGMPEPARPPATLSLVDAETDRALLALGAFTVLDAGSVAGRDLTVAAAAAVPGVASARLTSGDGHVQVENVTPYALFGDRGGDFRGGLALAEGERVDLDAGLFAGRGASGASLGRTEARLLVQSGTIDGGRYHAPDVFAFDEARMGADRLRGFEGFDRLAFLGGVEAGEVLGRAEVVGRDTVIDLGDGNVLTLVGFTELTADHML